MRAISMCSGDAAVTCSRCFGMTGSGCRFTPNAWNAVASPGPRPRTGSLRSRRRSSATSWRGSTGVIHSEPGAPMRQGDSVWGHGPHGRARIGFPTGMVPSALPDDIEALKRLVVAREADFARAQADLVRSRARETSAEAVIAPLALEAVRQMDAIFAIEREINGLTPSERVAVRRERSAPLVRDLEHWMRSERARLSRHAEVAKTMDYMLKRWSAFAGFLADGRICLTNNAAERALRGIALGRKAWLFAGSDRGGERAALMYTLIQTARLNDVDPQAWLADVLARVNGHSIRDLDRLLPWHWTRTPATLA